MSLRAWRSNLNGCNSLKLGDCFVALLRLGRAARLELADRSRRGLTMTCEKTFYESINIINLEQ
jgi:hypothetical protein